MKTKIIIKLRILLVLLFCCLVSCEDYLEVEAPHQKIATETVFSSDEMALSLMTGIYNQLASAFFSNGGFDSVTVLSGLSSDILTPIRSTNLPYMEFEQHEISPDNFRNLNLWSSAYNMIYMTNSLLEGLENSSKISEEVRLQLEGEASFVRAFTYFYLTSLYGDVPLILSTDYRVNELSARDAKEEVYQQVIADLEAAANLLADNFATGERTGINRYTAIALLARVQLYLENWEEAERLSSQVIAQSGTYELVEDLNQVFLANSPEAIWQLSPIGRGSVQTNTNEGAAFIIHPFLSFLSHLKLNDGFVASFEEEDNRLLKWVGYHAGTESYYPYKYKVRNSTEDLTEYSMVLRLAEQYLIRAEARARLDDLYGAIADLDRIRIRAGLEPIGIINPGIGKEELIDAILEARAKELFAEWGHRWLDLKRTNRAGEAFGANPLWEQSDVYYPIPEAELMKNPNLTQNNGY